ncbi:MAG: hypothetical protein JSU86_18445 [Phycisphaerales bacterium]|nr:MAG: hypothetical protein JSU86_18445 [Phycisphaerales bacterium]
MASQSRQHPRCRAFAVLLVVATTGTIFACNSLVAAEEIQWRSSPSTLNRLDQTGLSDALAELAARPNARHIVVQLNCPVGPD